MQVKAVAVALALALILVAGCGSQLSRSEFEAMAGGDGTSGGVAGTESSGETAGEDVLGPEGDAPGAEGAAGGTEGGPAAGGPGGGPAAGPGGGDGKANYASDVGVTENAIKLGNITTIGGPMPGQFEPFLLGIRTWVNATNERGGINGRKIQFSPCDDGMDAERNKSCARDLIENQKVFAIIGTNTPAMPSAGYINDQKVPAVGVAPIGNYTSQLPYWFQYDGQRICPRNGVVQEGAPGYCASNTRKTSSASYNYFKETVGVTKAAVFWHNIAISKQAGLDIAHNLESSGVEVVYTGETQVAEPDYTSHVLQMRDRGVEGVWNAMEINNNIRLLQAMDRQGWAPKASVATVAAYGQEIGKQLKGPSRNTLFALHNSRPYTDTSNPAVSSFIKLFDKYFKGKSKHAWNVDGYRGGLMFGDGAAALGADLTREGLVKWLNALKDYDPHGLGIPTDFRPMPEAAFSAPRPPQSCFSVARFKDTDWVDAAGGDFVCRQGEWIEPRG